MCVYMCVRVSMCVCLFAYAIESMTGQVNIRVGREKGREEVRGGVGSKRRKR